MTHSFKKQRSLGTTIEGANFSAHRRCIFFANACALHCIYSARVSLSSQRWSNEETLRVFIYFSQLNLFGLLRAHTRKCAQSSTDAARAKHAQHPQA